MITKLGDRTVVRFLTGGASVVILIAGIRAVASIFSLVVLAVLLALSVQPLLTLAKRRGLRTRTALALTVLGLVAGGFSVAGVLGVAVAGLSSKLPQYGKRLNELYQQTSGFLNRHGLDPARITELDFFQPRSLVSMGGSLLNNISDLLSVSLILLVLAILFLAKISELEDRLASDSYPPDGALARWRRYTEGLDRYISITGLTGLFAAGANFLLLAALGVDFAIVWGFLSFFLSFIPMIGLIGTLVPPALLALLEFGPGRAAVVVAGLLLINAIIDNVIKPRLIGEELNIPLLEVFLSLIFWSWVLGPIGSVLAVPLTLVLKNLVQTIEPGREPAAEAEAPGTE